MSRQLDLRPVIIVESDADQSVIGPHLLDEKVRCSPGFSKTATLLAARLHRENGDDWVIAVVDRDFDANLESNVIATTHYDLEADIFFGHRLLISRYVYRSIISEQLDHDSARVLSTEAIDEAEEIASSIGAVRHESHHKGHGVSLAALPIAEVLRRADQQDAIWAAAQLACHQAGRTDLQNELEEGAREVLKSESPSHLCRGHDLISVLCTRIGDHLGQRPRPRDFARGIHSLVNCEAFRDLSVYDDLRAWFLALDGSEMWDCAA